ncbi:MAG TPA: ribonuclease HII, partial [Candidatus Binatia bacterium]|nr:ribonuclease HII [Candidatus Binatia bacterium]
QFRKFEEEGYARGFKCVAGVDEVGRGPLAGPVVAAAVILPRGFFHPEIRDSKLLTPKQREKLAPLIRQSALNWGLGVVDVADIDRINILKASLLAMLKALEGLNARPDCVLIDGHQQIPTEFLSASRCFAARSLYQKTIISGDQLCVSIAAASIVAKVARDEMMVELDKRFPEYGFASHKGYACDAHLEALRRYGPSPVHRRSFQPVREAAIAQESNGAPSPR